MADSGSHDPVAEARKIFGPFRLLRIISEGATGVVLEAEHRTLGRRIALKTFNPKGFQRSGMNVSQMTELFLNEARVQSSIENMHVLPIYDAGFARAGDMLIDVPYMALKLVSNGDLGNAIDRHGALPFPRVLRLARECALGLQAVHAAGYVHRDIKPGNILIEDDGLARITDFSVARPVSELENDKIVVGTPGYLAPEQIVGYPASARTDLYALGVTLLFALAGTAPSADDHLEILERFNDRNDQRSSCLAAIVAHTVSPDPAERYADASQLVEDCVLVEAGTSPRHAPLGKWRRRLSISAQLKAVMGIDPK
jgi:eukaryotic-like serine/threonine-protein kinase